MINYLTTCLLLFVAHFSFSQCVDFDDDTYETCAGVPVTYNGDPSSLFFNIQESVDFNSGTLPTGWFVNGGATFTQPCGSGSDNTPYYWASTAGSGSPYINSNVYDFSSGGQVVFDMVYAVQGGASPCEGPDLSNEGVSLMYSIDNGQNWNEIVYYSPGGFELPSNPQTTGSAATGPTAYTTWSTFTVAIPQAAQTPNTMLRWEQLNSSGVCCDNWGVDNIHVETAVNGVNYVWSNGTTTLPMTVSSNVDTSYVLSVFDGNMSLMCTDTVFLNIDNSGFDNGVQVITDNFVSGQSTNLIIDAYNDGCPVQNGEVVVKLGSLLTYNSSTPPADIITTDSLIFNYSNLYKNSPHHVIEMNVSTDAAANIGDTVLLDALIYNTSGDINLVNNEKNYVFTVSSGPGSDIKRVYPKGDCDIGYVENDELITYTIRFQNDESGTVVDARIRESIDTNLDPASLKVVATSHELSSIDWINSTLVDFTFDSIMLPTQSQNELESVGYIVFEIDQQTGLSHGASFTNQAEVAFDAMSPQLTNEVVNTITDGSHAPIGDTLEVSAPSAYNWNGQLLTSSGVYTQLISLPDGCDSTAILSLTLDSDVGLDEVESSSVQIFPNPANNQVTVIGKEAATFRLLSASGQLILEQKIQAKHIIPLGGLSSGVYYVEVISSDETVRNKLIIEK
ncbi:MAG: T9SS type A sorting domain-containing protein [bacterium]|nr:T9SS type A sorting domain-containing protein [bacterium]